MTRLTVSTITVTVLVCYFYCCLHLNAQSSAEPKAICDLKVCVLEIQFGKIIYHCFIQGYPSPKHVMNEEGPSEYLPDSSEMKYWYDIGIRQCQSYLSSAAFDTASKEPMQQPIMWPAFSAHPRPGCRGSSLLHHMTGMIPWVFGPNNCSTYSACWLGVLTCGDVNSVKMKLDAFKKGSEKYVKEQIIHTRTDTGLTLEQFMKVPFQGWSLKGLHTLIRLVGPELVAPRMHLVPLPSSWGAAARSYGDVLIAQYNMTIPGQYKLEARLLEFYPMSLFSWTRQQLHRGYDAWASVYLGPTEWRCPRPFQACGLKNFSPKCDQKAFVSNSINKMITIRDGGARCQDHWDKARAGPLDRSGKPALPLCSGGAHPGRWIQIPPIVASRCGAEPFISKDGPFQTMPYLFHSEKLNTTHVWEEFYSKFGSGESESGGISYERWKHQELTDEELYYLELSR
jgi:hypothetical protein